MADNARDLQFRVLSDLSKLDLDKGARQLDDLGDVGKRALDKLDDGVTTARRSIGDYADDARDAARNIRRAFDDISGASRKSAKDIDDDFEKAGKGLDEFKDEARSSGREAAASFGGGFSDIGDFVQETAANAFGGFGPIGAAAGIAAAAGIGIITNAFSNAKESAEQARAAVSDWIQAYVDGLGEIKEATIEAKLNEFAQDGGKKLRELGEAARAAGVDVADYQRAQAGDVEAQKRVAEQYKKQVARLAELSGNRDADAGAIARQSLALQQIASDLGYTNSQMQEGKARADELREALQRDISAKITVGIDIPSPAELDRINRLVRSGIGEIVVPVKPGQSRYANTTNNSRYRN